MLDAQRIADMLAITTRLVQPQVYFLREEEDGPIKIGYAANALLRLSRLQAGNPSVLRVGAMIESCG
jgi:hypothetical protein